MQYENQKQLTEFFRRSGGISRTPYERAKISKGNPSITRLGQNAVRAS